MCEKESTPTIQNIRDIDISSIHLDNIDDICKELFLFFDKKTIYNLNNYLHNKESLLIMKIENKNRIKEFTFFESIEYVLNICLLLSQDKRDQLLNIQHFKIKRILNHILNISYINKNH